MEANKKGLGKIIALSIVAAVVFAAALGTIIFLRSDKVVLGKAFKRLADDNMSYTEAVIGKENLNQLTTAITEGNSEISYKINVDGIEEIPITIGLDGKVVKLTDERKASIVNKVSVMNNKLVEADIWVDDYEVYATVPEFLDSTLKLDTEHMADKFNSSVLASWADIRIPDELNAIDIWKLAECEPTRIDPAVISSKYADDIKALVKSIDISKTKNSASVELSDGSSAKCKVYVIKVPKHEINVVLKDIVKEAVKSVDDYLDYLGVSDEEIDEIRSLIKLSDDLEFSVYVDKKGNIRSITTNEHIKLEDDVKLDILIEFMGKEVATDMVKTKIKLSDYNDIVIKTQTERDTKGAYETELYFDDDYDELKVVISGLNSYSAGEMTCEVDNFKVFVDSEALIHIKGDITAIADDDASVKIPSENVIDVLNMSYSDLEKIAQEISSKADSILALREQLEYFF